MKRTSLILTWHKYLHDNKVMYFRLSQCIAHKKEETAVAILRKAGLSKCDFAHVPRLYS